MGNQQCHTYMTYSYSELIIGN